jgi:siderophore synthetase component
MISMNTKIKDREQFKILSALCSPQFVQVRRRIFRQLIESLIYEDVVQPKSRLLGEVEEEYTIEGRDKTENAVSYMCRGKRKVAFGRIRLSQEPVKRIVDGREAEAECLCTFLCEISPLLKEEARQLPAFINEIQQTLLKDTIAQFRRSQNEWTDLNRSYDELEGDVMDGHPYHPCYKSRVGFDLVDNEAFGPDFKPNVKLLWVAIKKEHAHESMLRSLDLLDFMKKEIGMEDYARFVNKLRGQGDNPDEYLFVPVHPWQWREKIVSAFFQQIKEGQIVLLGEGSDEYSPQQSIRTLGNGTFYQKANVKLSLSITNTSSSRVLLPRHVRNGPIVSGWLASILDKDSYLKEELRLVFLKELLGISYDYENLPKMIEEVTFGTLGVIWRESLHTYLEPGEDAIPFTAICHVNVDSLPFIDRWVKESGLENWVRKLLQTSVLPLIHLLYAHGIAIESHAQNMVLIHRQGIPVRLALRDFSGGVLIYKEDANPDLYPETDKAVEVRDVFHNAFFFINLAEISMFLEEHYQLEEQTFWTIVSEMIESYQKRFSHLKDRFEMFDLYEEIVEVGQLTKRKLVGETEKGDHDVYNVLYPFRDNLNLTQ